MNEERKSRMEVLLLDEADRLSKLQTGSDEYAKTSRFITDIFRELNSMDKIENEVKAEELKADIDSENASYERDFKERELDLKEEELADEKKKSKKEFIARIVTVGASIAAPVLVAVLETKGFFAKLSNWKASKF